MKRYFENFSLVELNSTFYQYPQEKTVEGWRKRAPEGFEFTVKAHQDISHKAKMKAEETSLHVFERMKRTCKTLNAKILVFQTPASFRPERLGDAEGLFRAVKREDLILVWETRGPAWESPEVFEKLKRVLEELNVAHVTDPFRILPAFIGEVAYFRLHGLGEQMYYYQYTDHELRRLKELVSPYERKASRIYVLFNNLAMFADGARFMAYLSKGVFPKVTGSVGLASVKSVAEKVRYPAAKSMLLKRLGWQLVEVEEGKQMRLEALLTDLHSKSYESAEQLIGEIRAVEGLRD